MLEKEYAKYISDDLKLDEKQLDLVHKLEKYSNRRFFDSIFKKQIHLGIYIHGGVGTGKTTVMNAFFQYSKIKNKKRIHCTHLLQELNNYINEGKRLNIKDSLEYALEKYSNIKLLCIDEFEILDIVSSLFLRKLIEYLSKKRCYFVFTSNSLPQNLYKHGLQREKFLELVKYMQDIFEIFHLDGGQDYRKKITTEYLKTHNTLVSQGNHLDILQEFILSKFYNQIDILTKTLDVNGRLINVYHCQETFLIDVDIFCQGNYGTFDYRKIVQSCSRIVLFNLQQPNLESPDYWRRFCLLIDEIYDSNRPCNIISRFEYSKFDLDPFIDKIPQIKRTFSRLHQIDTVAT